MPEAWGLRPEVFAKLRKTIIEGIYGREGPLLFGPGPAGYDVDLLTNLAIFGKNALHVDNIGVFLAGHEPAKSGLLHLALERGLSKFLNPRDTPVYEWGLDGSARRTRCEDLPRASIRTLYLPEPNEQAAQGKAGESEPM